MRRVLPLALLLLVLWGCGQSQSTDVVVPLDQVPENLMKAARKELPDVKFDHARKKADGVWEIRGKTKTGRVREVELDSSGKVLKTE
jgi:hypothetical protein